jgi:two-component system response regulator FixJ
MAENSIVFVVDDDVSMCELISATLQRAGLTVRTFPSVDEFAKINVEQERAGMCCCLLLDLVMPGRSGLDFLEKRYASGFSCPVIVISASATVQTAVRSMKLGAVDFLVKPFAPEKLSELVLKTLSDYKAARANDPDRQVVRSRIAALSPRERELLRAIVLGNSTKMIANMLGISARTVDHHRANLMDKMRAANVADLVRMAVLADYATVEGYGDVIASPEK